MQFPLQLGLGAFSGVDERSLERFLRFAQGTGYSNAEESLRVVELRAWAYIAAIAANTIDRAGSQIFPNLCSELLDEWELAEGLRHTAARNDTERKLRIEAKRRAWPSKARIEAALQHAGLTSAIFYSNTRDDVDSRGVLNYNPPLCPPESIFQCAVILSAAEYAEHAKKATVLDILEACLPGRSLHHMDDPGIDGLVANSLGCIVATGILDRSVLDHPSAGAPNADNVRAPSRLKNFGRLSKLRAADLNAIQENSLFDVCSGSETMTGTTPGGAWYVFAVSVPATSSVTIVANSVKDWRDRLIVAFGRSSSNDIRPGGAADDELNNTANVWYGVTFSNGGSTPTNDPRILIDVVDDSAIHVNASGDLTVYNGDASTQYFVGLLFATGDLGEV